MIYLSPTEHQIQQLLKSTDVPFQIHQLCEANGVDVIVTSRVGLIGFQRKTLPDLEASLRDGRLARELGQIRSSRILRHSVLISEYNSSRITTDRAGFLDTTLSRNALRSIALKCQLTGVLYLQSESVADTILCITGAVEYIASNRAEDLYR